MQLDKRSSKLFDELMSNPGINSKELEEKYDLTRRKLGYSFNKINDWLLMKNLPEIERTRQGHFIIDQSLITKMSDEQEIDLSDMNILSESQRVYMIMLMLLSSEEELSLNHFTSELDVSKNTILKDLERKSVEERSADVYSSDLIERTRPVDFIIDQSLITKMSDEQEIDLSDMNILSESQRVYMIMLMLLSSEEELSLNHFTSELDVSKNTILNDLKQVREIASDYGEIGRASCRERGVV